MPERLEPILRGSAYHIYNRGVNRNPIFFSHRNYIYFIFKMAQYFEGRAHIYAYCLMPNHFHILVNVDSDDFSRDALKPLFAAYSKAINAQEERVGPLFQGRFKANLIGNDAHLLDCVHYIHMNPVEAGLVRSPSGWEFSSFNSYLAPNTPNLVDTSYVMKFYDTVENFVRFSPYERDRPAYMKDD